ncbi:hypothetical protein D7B24_003309 [Verticillium nonalfalfae]|uniref:Uncharacterized protein n=1 Tax=Verticillium nonalfalfae TaxID=1051616 RepID=A0A3M9XY74_9PEZI|nr:uncharacterized protein D7B24_003309 [Verticillium nonalfalfae]RNJ52566.1 hypothetical protein D7B24_003309 [Verticillium nonalfalfae]
MLLDAFHDLLVWNTEIFEQATRLEDVVVRLNNKRGLRGRPGRPEYTQVIGALVRAAVFLTEKHDRRHHLELEELSTLLRSCFQHHVPTPANVERLNDLVSDINAAELRTLEGELFGKICLATRNEIRQLISDEWKRELAALTAAGNVDRTHETCHDEGSMG